MPGKCGTVTMGVGWSGDLYFRLCHFKYKLDRQLSTDKMQCSVGVTLDFIGLFRF